MEYQGLIEDDVINARALNRAWLKLAASGPERFAALDEKRRKRLADAPFLLFTLRENDLQLWSTLLSDRPQRDLFAACPDAGQRELQVACLAWLWELARRNPYVARIVAGARAPAAQRSRCRPRATAVSGRLRNASPPVAAWRQRPACRTFGRPGSRDAGDADYCRVRAIRPTAGGGLPAARPVSRDHRRGITDWRARLQYAAA